ncbi:MAG: radical SAM protein [Theionarchaea archaeon]|nr:radical SAM protein [Theionarchaea archaeon]
MKFLLLSPHKWDPASPPAALDYIAEALEKSGIRSEIADVTFTELQELESLLQKTRYEGICLTIRNLERTVFSERLHFPLPAIKNMVNMIKKYCDCPVIVGGGGFSIMPERILEYLGADYGFFRGGEEALPLLIEYLFENKGNLEEIPHLVYFDKGKTTCNSPFSYQRILPPVKRGYFNYHRYFRPRIENFSKFAPVETKRGCPYTCVYCVEPEIKGRTVRVKPVEDVTKEVDYFLSKGIDHFFIADSEFNADVDAAVELMQYWKEKGYHRKMKWLAYTTPCRFSEELAQLLPESGSLCITIDFGHVLNKMLSNLGKGHTVKDIENAVSFCQEHNANFKGSLMLGGPGETRETIREAIEFFSDIRCEIFLSLGIRVFPCTPLGEMVQKSGPLVENPNLYGKVVNNDDLFEPVYYISCELEEDIFGYLQEFTETSEQFYTLAPHFRLIKTMHGHFRGVQPEYETSGHLDQHFITRSSKEVIP